MAPVNQDQEVQIHRQMVNDASATSVLKRHLGSSVTSVWRSNSGVPIKTRRHIAPPNKDGKEWCLINPQGLKAGVPITFTACL